MLHTFISSICFAASIVLILYTPRALSSAPFHKRSTAAALCAIAATAFVPVVGPLSTTGAGVAFYPLLIISALLSTKHTARAAALSAVIIVYAVVMDVFMMRVGVPGGRFTPEGAAMVLRLSSIADARLCVAMICASVAIIVATMPLCSAERGSRALLLAVCAQGVVPLNIFYCTGIYISNVKTAIVIEIIASLTAIAIDFIVSEYLSRRLASVRARHFYFASVALLICCAVLMACAVSA